MSQMLYICVLQGLIWKMQHRSNRSEQKSRVPPGAGHVPAGKEHAHGSPVPNWRVSIEVELISFLI